MILMLPIAWRRRAKGSRFPVGVMATEKKAIEGIELIREGHYRSRGALSGSRPSVPSGSSAPRWIGPLPFFSLILGVYASHGALKLGKFADHVGEKIGLHHSCRAAHLGLDGQPECRGEVKPAICCTLSALSFRFPSRLWNLTASSLSEERIEGDLFVLFEKKLGVGETRPQHPFIPSYDLGRRNRHRVRKEEQTRGARSLPPP